MLFATAGHVDHGKTTLIRALTGVDTDRLPEEAERGISIDLGFAYWTPDSGGDPIGFIDVPGHERYLRNMIAGLCGVEHALLVVAADEGIMPQTREHLAILDLLGFRHVFVVLSKIDRVDTKRLGERHAEVAALLAGTRFAEAPQFAVSALKGTGLANLAQALAGTAASVPEDGDHTFRLAIDRAFSVKGAGTVVTGTVVSGTLEIDTALTLYPQGIAVRLRGIERAGCAVERAGRGSRCALNLSGVAVADLHRGDWLLAAPQRPVSRRIDVQLHVLPDRPTPLRHDLRVHLHHGSAAIGARLLLPGQRSWQPGASGLACLALDHPTLATSGDRFVLRDQSGRILLGGGTILNPLGDARRRPLAQRERIAAAMALPDPADRLAALSQIPGYEPVIEWFCDCCNLTPDAAARAIAKADIVRAGERQNLAIGRARHAQICADLLAGLARFHADHPDLGGMPRQQARLLVSEGLSADLFGSIVTHLMAEGAIATSSALLRLHGHAPAFSQAESQFWRNTVSSMQDGPPRPIAVADLARELRMGEAAVLAMLQRRRACGDLWQVANTRFMLASHVASLGALAAGIASNPGQGFTAAEFRDASGIGRNFVIQLLEFFDRIGVTRRQGNCRQMKDGWQAIVGWSERP